MERIPNQREVIISKPNYAEDKVLYFVGSVKYTMEAMQTLSGNGFKLYMYFLKNVNGYTEILVPAVIARTIGLSRTTYYRAFDELAEHRYIHLQKGKTSNYIFCDRPYSASTKAKVEE